MFEAKPSTEGIRLSFIKTPEKYRGQGLASEALKELTAVADKHQVKITGDVDPQTDEGEKPGLSKAKLFQWYGNHGFQRLPYDMEPDKLSDAIIRNPKPPGEQPAPAAEPPSSKATRGREDGLKLAKNKNFDSTGNWKVTFHDGEVRYMFNDADTMGGWRESVG